MAFELVSCQLLHFGPHTTMAGRQTGTVRVKIRETFLGNTTEYALDLPVKADCGPLPHDEVRTHLLAHAARQLNKLKARHTQKLSIAAE